ncbi:unnamed protein product, partial [Didymodactylos carnosus]
MSKVHNRVEHLYFQMSPPPPLPSITSSVIGSLVETDAPMVIE